jgi:hypothetical protein
MQAGDLAPVNLPRQNGFPPSTPSPRTPFFTRKWELFARGLQSVRLLLLRFHPFSTILMRCGLQIVTARAV